MGRLTWSAPDGHWGVHGLDWNGLDTLSPAAYRIVYGAMRKLKDMEDRVEELRAYVKSDDLDLAGDVIGEMLDG